MNFASNHYRAANQFYNVQNYFPSLSNLKNENQFYTIETLLRRNVPGSEKMLNSYIIDNPTSYLSETAFYDAANFYFKNGKYSYALKWYNRISENDVSKIKKIHIILIKDIHFLFQRDIMMQKNIFKRFKMIRLSRKMRTTI